MKAEHPEDFNKEEQEFLKHESPVLHSMEKTNPFTVPAGYFDTLPAEIQEKISARKESPWYVLLLKGIFRPQPAFALIALFVIITGAVYFLYQRDHIKSKDELAITTDLKNAEIALAIDESVLLDEVATLQDENETYKGNENEIENYLIDNQTDINQLINEL